MKFNDGYWQMRPGMTPYYAAQVHDLEIDDASLTVYAPTKKLQGRGDTLNLPFLTVQFSSPLKNVIRVKIIHHKGGQPRKPEFEIHQQPDLKVVTANTEKYATLASGDLSVLQANGCDVITIGQYLQPTKKHLPVHGFVHPNEFAEYKEIGYNLGLDYVESGPLVRSSYHSERHVFAGLGRRQWEEEKSLAVSH